MKKVFLIILALTFAVSFSAQALTLKKTRQLIVQLKEIIPQRCLNNTRWVEEGKWALDVYLNGMYKNKAFVFNAKYCSYGAIGPTEIQYLYWLSMKDVEDKALVLCQQYTKGEPCIIIMRNDKFVGGRK